jgi:hypothetical protein
VLGSQEGIGEWIVFGMAVKGFQALPICRLLLFRNERTASVVGLQAGGVRIL